MLVARPPPAELLRRTAEKKDERYKERLDDYYRRNFSDYFQFVDSSDSRGLSPETRHQIKQWLKKNVDDPKQREAFPAPAAP